LLTFEQMKELVDLVARHRLRGLELERAGFRFKVDGFQEPAAPPAAAPLALLSQHGFPGPAAQAAPSARPSPGGLDGLPREAGAPPALAAAPPPGLPVHAGELGAPGAAARAGAPAAHILSSPIVGTFYRSPSPDAPPFTEVGARVRKGQVLCIIEAMKLMNEIESDVDGTVVETFPQNAQAVEFGEPLFAIQT